MQSWLAKMNFASTFICICFILTALKRFFLAGESSQYDFWDVKYGQNKERPSANGTRLLSFHRFFKQSNFHFMFLTKNAHKDFIKLT